MSLEIITGKTGEPHIDSEDIGAYNAYTIGKDSYLLNGLDMSITNVNTLHVGTGEVLFQGRHVRIKGNGEDVAIANGTTGYKRNDILCLKYQKFPQNSDIESISLELIKGTPTTGTPADPAITTGSILNGDTVVYLKLARIVVNGLTPEAPVKLLGTVKTLADTAQTVAQIGASVDQIKVEQRGTSGIWEYAKYSNGIAECWGIDYTGSFNINTLWGNGFYISDNIAARNYPFTFKSAPRELAQITLVNPANHNTVYTGIKSLQAVNSTSKTCAYQMLRSGSGTGFAAKIEYYVRGEWK